MAQLPDAAKAVLRMGHVVWVSTVGSDGWPNVAIKGTAGLIDDDTVYFADVFSKKTRANLESDPRVALGVYNSGLNVAVQIKGHATLIESGELFDDVARKIKRHGYLAPMKYLVQVKVESVYDMSAGPDAGKRLS